MCNQAIIRLRQLFFLKQVAASGRGRREAHRAPACPATAASCTAACGGPRRSAALRLCAKLSAHPVGHERLTIGVDLRHGEKDRGGGRGSFSRSYEWFPR